MRPRKYLAEQPLRVKLITTKKNILEGTMNISTCWSCTYRRRFWIEKKKEMKTTKLT